MACFGCLCWTFWSDNPGGVVVLGVRLLVTVLGRSRTFRGRAAGCVGSASGMWPRMARAEAGAGGRRTAATGAAEERGPDPAGAGFDHPGAGEARTGTARWPLAPAAVALGGVGLRVSQRWQQLDKDSSISIAGGDVRHSRRRGAWPPPPPISTLAARCPGLQKRMRAL